MSIFVNDFLVKIQDPNYHSKISPMTLVRGHAL